MPRRNQKQLFARAARPYHSLHKADRAEWIRRALTAEINTPRYFRRAILQTRARTIHWTLRSRSLPKCPDISTPILWCRSVMWPKCPAPSIPRVQGQNRRTENLSVDTARLWIKISSSNLTTQQRWFRYQIMHFDKIQGGAWRRLHVCRLWVLLL